MNNPILHHHIYGQGDPLIIIHGLFGSSRNWQTLAKRYAEHFKVVTVDVRNHGHSFHDEEMYYALMTQDIVNLMMFLNFPMAHVLGHSMGGKIAMTLAHRHPQFLNKLIVADIAPEPYLHDYHDLIDVILALDLSVYKHRQDVDQALVPLIPDIGLRQFLLQSLYHKESELNWKINWPAIKKNIQAIIGFDSITDWNIVSPTLFIHGALSNYVTEKARKRIQQHFKYAEFEEISGAGHWLHAEQPQSFFEKTRRFLQQ